jgi:hypothetical protein
LRSACEPKFAITAAIAREILTVLAVPEPEAANHAYLLEVVTGWENWRGNLGDFAWHCVHAYERKLVRRDRDGRAKRL